MSDTSQFTECNDPETIGEPVKPADDPFTRW